jgi:formylglycine-generating enzyme required for sulfatase activity
MQAPVVLLQSLADALARAPGSRGDEALARVVWPALGARPEAARRDEVALLARLGGAETRQLAQTLAPGPDARDALLYLAAVPATVRRALRRPSDPTGTTLPPDLPLAQPADLLRLLPTRAPHHLPGDRLTALGGWELVELRNVDAVSETWKAIQPGLPHQQTAALTFCTAPGLRERLRGDGGALLTRVADQATHPGLVRLQRAYLDHAPPVLQFEDFEAGNVAALAREWEAEPQAVARLIRGLAEALGQAHRLRPPLVHRRLDPSRVLVRRGDGGEPVCKITGLGLLDLLPPRLLDPRYCPPEQARGQPPDPRQDVYALGVLWHQLLTGDLNSARPGGSSWRRRLAERGLAAAMVELIEVCFEEEPQDRPADAAVLAERLGALVAVSGQRGAAASRGAAGRPAEPSRQRQRRANVWDIFESLDKPEPELAKLLTNSAGVRLALLQAGTFLMGSPDEEPGRCEKEGPRHEIMLTNAFYLGIHPVTQAQFEQVMGRNPSRFHAAAGGGPEHPVESVTWEEAVEFCRRLSALPAERDAGRVYRLPTEAEWEYACRGGTTTPFCYGATLTAALANFDGHFPYEGAEKGRAAQKTTRVGAYPANNFGLCDLHGNVWEWCADWHDAGWYRRSPKRNPQGPAEGEFRVLRGGSWRNHAATCRSAYRNGLGPKSRDAWTGFRVALDLPAAR